MIISSKRLDSFFKASLLMQISLLFLWGCDSSDHFSGLFSNYEKFSGPTQGTHYHITAKLPKNISHQVIQELITAKLENIDQSMSTYRSDSQISIFNTLDVNKPFTVNQDFIDVLGISREVYEKSSGAFDPSVKRLVDLWGFGVKLTVKQFEKIPNEDEILQAKMTMNFLQVKNQGLSLEKKLPVELDFNGIAQGFTVDALAKILSDNGITDYMIEVGGELATKGVSARGTPWRIGIVLPDQLHEDSNIKTFAALVLNTASVATSGDYRNYYEVGGKRFSHTIDPRTGRPIEHKLASVTIIAKTVAHADAWATAMMVLGDEKGFELAESIDLPAYFIYRINDKFAIKTTKAMIPYIEH